MFPVPIAMVRELREGPPIQPARPAMEAVM